MQSVKMLLIIFYHNVILFSFSSYHKNNNTIIKVENYCSELIEFENGLPLSKEDSIYHGYGTKSIDYIAKKYGGYCLFEQKNNIFSVTICFFK